MRVWILPDPYIKVKIVEKESLRGVVKQWIPEKLN